MKADAALKLKQVHSDAVPQVQLLSMIHAQEITKLERLCYPSPWSEELIRAEFASEVSLRLGLLWKNAVIAYSFSHLLSPELHLLNLAVAPQYQGRGLGRYLLCNVLLNAVHRGCNSVMLEVRAGNIPAQRLYFSAGFETVGIRRNYYQNNAEDALLLSLNIGSGDSGLLKQVIQNYQEAGWFD